MNKPGKIPLAVRSLSVPALAVLMTVASGGAHAAPWTFLPGHAQISFTIDHFGFSQTQGAFRDFTAEIDFDPDNMEATKFTVTVDAASIDTRYEPRDKHLRTADFLDVEKYPKITFASTKVTKTGDNTADIEGDLTLHGVTKPVTLKARLIHMGEEPTQKLQVAGYEITTDIDRTQWGMETYAPYIGSVVKMTFDIEITPVK